MRLLGCCCLRLVVVAGVDVGNTPGWSWWWWILELMASLSNTILDPSPATRPPDTEVVNSDSFADAVVVTVVVLGTVVVVDAVVVVVETVVVAEAVVGM